MNGAQALIRTLVDAGVDVCFANPGTSEMHFVAALDDVPEMRGGARACSRAWPPARPTATPAWPAARRRRCCTSGPGLGNGLANLHNARRGPHADRQHRRRPRHATTSGTTRRWSPTSTRWPAPSPAGCAARCRPADVGGRRGRGGGGGVVGRPAQVATLILPADVSWEDGAEPAAPRAGAARAARWRRRVVEDVADGARARASRPCSSSAGDAAWTPTGCWPRRRSPPAPARGCCAETFPARLRARRRAARRRRGCRYLAEMAIAAARRARSTWCWSTRSRRCRSSPTPDKPSDLVPEGCAVHVLGAPGEDGVAALEALADAWPRRTPTPDAAGGVAGPELPTGALTPRAMAAVRRRAAARGRDRRRRGADRRASGWPSCTAGAPAARLAHA